MVWRPGELDEEIRAGAWQVLPAEAKTVFHANPAGLWRDLHRAEEGPGRAVRIRLEQPQSARAPQARLTPRASLTPNKTVPDMTTIRQADENAAKALA